MTKLNELSIRNAAEKLRKKEISSLELANACFSQIDEKDDSIGAYLTLCRESATDFAKRIDSVGEFETPLCGIPMAIKDNICTIGVRTTCASRMLEDYVSPYDATVVKKLSASGAIMLGKLNMDEFAMGSTGERSYFKVTRNPVNPERVPGGSSSGSAAAVAAKMALFTLGTDTGGSVRQPAALCGIVGMKPTYGSVSRYGLIEFASSLDQIGPMTRDVYDNALVFNAICGHDERESTSGTFVYGDVTNGIDKGIKGIKIGIAPEFFEGGVSPDVNTALMAAVKAYADMGAEIVDIRMRNIGNALSAYYIISSAEASSNFGKYNGINFGYRTKSYKSLDELYKKTRSEGFGEEVTKRIMLGTFVLGAGNYDSYYNKALKIRTLIIEDFIKAFERCDVILAPVTKKSAGKLGQKTEDSTILYSGDSYTCTCNLAGVPALSLPCGKDGCGMPIGMQLIGNNHTEQLLYRIGYAFEQYGSINKSEGG